MKKITIRSVPDGITSLHQHPLLHRIYAARGIVAIKELEHELKNLLPYDSLKDINRAVEVLTTALKAQQNVLIVGDFDADGATSTALAILALKSLGLKNISYLIPNRFEYGYGLTPEIVAVGAERKPDLIVTVDNGIASIDGVRAANENGIKVLITDHHLPGDDLPEAEAIINPNQKGDEFSGKSLAGVGVVFYLMLALRAHLRDIGWFLDNNISEPNMAQFLDLVALGTFADAVTLDHNNRILVMQGMNRIRSGKGRVGIEALFLVSKRNYTKASVYDLGFVIAPRLNAAGRLDDMSLGVECLLTDDPVRARTIARELNSLNDERRGIEKDMQHQALRLVDNLQLEQNLPPGLCVFEESWHQGVLGILAGRLKDRLHRPVIAFAASNENEIKGSARSVGNVHIRDVLSNIAAKNPGLITRFGGHAMAAGLSLAIENYPAFSQAFADEVGRYLTLEDLGGIVETDGELPAEYFNLETAELLHAAGPWGSGFAEPLFFGEFAFAKQVLVGSKHLKLILRHLETKQEVEAICFNIDVNIWPNNHYSKAKVVYRLGINEYNNQRKLQLIINEIISYE
ncbi:MAG: single-stranded-DNA-specific exonuclease RecJ [Gammaproteobacteria bacterium]|nr:single-stranded-DNA-specific exonuclease RecJ [Gammaproteobacteria bacterium]